MVASNKRTGLFISGTDTGVGKTLVAGGLVRLARTRGRRALAIKPVETGCALRDGVLYPEDGAFLREAGDNELSLDDCTPFRFSFPASPARAAAMEGRRLSFAEIEGHSRAVADAGDFTIVEGAGGLMVPIQDDLMMIDLMERLGFPVLVVARTKIGTVNHTLLSLEALRNRKVEVAGVVLSSSTSSGGPEEEFTPADISRFAKDIPVVVLPHLEEGKARNPSSIANVMAASWPDRVVNGWIG
ncbi:MAG TPA: dethiobiotin synthase [Desulfomonilaceae bacterium]|nr:dethiobiotin synthase [Desulfomonilaceae bacterium]